MAPLDYSFPDGFKYVFKVLDDHSRYVLIGCMDHRSVLPDVFHQIEEKFNKIAKKSLNKIDVNFSPFHKMHSDGAKEYVALQKDLGDFIDTSSSPRRILLN